MLHGSKKCDDKGWGMWWCSGEEVCGRWEW